MIDWTKPIRMSDGRPARLIGVLKNKGCRGDHAVAVDEGSYEWVVVTDEFGRWAGNGNSCVKNIPEEPKYRPYTYDEAKALVGTILITKMGARYLVTGCFWGIDTPWIVINGSTNQNAQDLLESWKHLDGTPCGVLVSGEAKG